jgi:hypothetical protein
MNGIIYIYENVAKNADGIYFMMFISLFCYILVYIWYNFKYTYTIGEDDYPRFDKKTNIRPNAMVMDKPMNIPEFINASK